MEEIKRTRRPRRSKKTLEKDVSDAITSLIEEVGFANVTLKEIAQRAKIEASVFYRRYSNLDQLFDEYTRKYDYWLGGIAELLPPNLNDEDAFKWIIRNLTKALYKDKGMQKLLVWELSVDNPTTRRTAAQRELVNQSLIKMLEQRFERSNLDMNVIAALVISGVYYLVLHQDISKFCDVDFSGKKGKERLDAALDQLVSLMFCELNRQNEMLEIANRLRSSGVSEDVIKSSLWSHK